MSSQASPRAVEAATDEYDLGDALPPAVGTVPRGTNLLVRGPTMSGKRELVLGTLAHGTRQGEAAVIVTSNESADRIASRFERLGDEDRLYVVDCSGTSGRGSFDDTGRVKHVSSPSDLTGVGIALAKCSQAIGADASAGVRMAFLSLSTTLQYASARRMFSFVHVVTGRTAAAGYLGVATIDPTIHDAADTNAIAAQFDGAIELREGEASREMRIRGLPDAPAGWREW